jgi:hypothetical protein
MSTTPAPTSASRLDRVLRGLGWGGALTLWLLPFLAARLTSEMNWSPMDHIAWGVMLLTGAGLFETSLRLRRSFAYRFACWIAMGAGFLLVWANLAVGIIGSEDAAINSLFFAVLAVPLVGAFLVDFRAGGLAWVMAATAAAQIAVAVPPLLAREPDVVFTLPWLAAWLISAALFRKAARASRSA